MPSSSGRPRRSGKFPPNRWPPRAAMRYRRRPDTPGSCIPAPASSEASAVPASRGRMSAIRPLAPQPRPVSSRERPAALTDRPAGGHRSGGTGGPAGLGDRYAPVLADGSGGGQSRCPGRAIRAARGVVRWAGAAPGCGIRRRCGPVTGTVTLTATAGTAVFVVRRPPPARLPSRRSGGAADGNPGEITAAGATGAGREHLFS